MATDQYDLNAEAVTLLTDLREFVPRERRGYYVPLIDALVKRLRAAQRAEQGEAQRDA